MPLSLEMPFMKILIQIIFVLIAFASSPTKADPWGGGQEGNAKGTDTRTRGGESN